MVDRLRTTGGGSFFDSTFKDEDYIDDSTFLKHPKQGSSGYIFGDLADISTESGAVDKRGQKLKYERERINRQTLEVSRRTLGMVHESEQIGIEAAQELLHQREQLENCETKVGDINRTLRTSQKHINSIKSIFGGFMNRFSKTSETSSIGKPQEDENAAAGLSLTLETAKAERLPLYKSEHPALRLRGVDYSPESYAARENLFDEKFSPEEKVEHQLNENLDDLGLGLSRLKGLAVGLGQEIEEQNAILDRLHTPIDKAELAIQRQNKEMKNILHK